MQDIQTKLTEFSEVIKGYTDVFVGREWLVQEINALLADPTCRFVVLTGGAGTGKTALMAHLAATHPNWPRYFIRRDSRDLLSPGDATIFLLTIGGQLATLYPHLFHPENLEVIVRQQIEDVKTSGEAIGAKIGELHASPFYKVALRVEQEIQLVSGKATGLEIGRLVSEPRLLTMQNLQYLGLLAPARLLMQEHPDTQIVVLVDALDELRYSPADPDVLRALYELPLSLSNVNRAKREPAPANEFPANLRFVVTSRREKFLDRLLGRSDVRELQLDIAGENNQADLRIYAKQELPVNALEAELSAERISKDQFLTNLLNKAAGNFLYLRSVVGAIQEALRDTAKRERLQSLVRIEALPNDLDALYDYFLDSIVHWIQKDFGDCAWRKYLRPLLGILAVAQEPLSEAQIIAFTGLDSEDLGDLLRELRQFVEPVDNQLAHRIYHTSFAEYLLDFKSNTDYRIDGPKWHAHIADYYLHIWGGLANMLPELQEPEKRDLDGGYGLRTLAAHLVGASRVEDLHYLLHLEWEISGGQWENLWFAVREAQGDISGFLVDIQRAWRLAEKQYSLDAPYHQQQLSQSLSLQLYYAFVVASLNSLASAMPSAVRTALLQKAIWSPSQAITDAKQVADPDAQVQALTDLIPLLDEPQRGRVVLDALAVARTQGVQPRARYLTKIASHLDGEERESVIQEALLAAQKIDWSGNYRAQALGNLLPLLPENRCWEVLDNAINTAKTDWDNSDFSSTISVLGPYLKPFQITEMLNLIRTIKDPFSKMTAFNAIVPHVESSQRAAIAREGLEVESKVTANSLVYQLSFSRFLPEVSYLDLLETAIREDDRTVSYLVSILPEDISQQQVQAVLARIDEKAQEFNREIKWFNAYIQLLPRVDPSLRHSLIERLFSEIPMLRYDTWRKEAYIKLAPYLSKDQLLNTKNALRTIYDENGIAASLTDLVGYLDQKLRHKVLTFILARVDRMKHLEILVKFARSLPFPDRDIVLTTALEAFQKGASVGGGISVNIALQKTLIDLAEIAPQEWRIDILNTLLRHIFNGPMSASWAASTFVELIRFLPLEILERGVRLLFEKARRDFTEAMQHNGSEGTPGDSGAIAGTLQVLAPHLTKDLLLEAVNLAQTIRDDGWRMAALAYLLPYLQGNIRDVILKDVLETQGTLSLDVDAFNDSLYRPLINLAKCLEGILRDQVLERALTAARSLHPAWRAGALIEVADLLPPDNKQDVLREAMQTANCWEMYEISQRFPPAIAYEMQRQTVQKAIHNNDVRALGVLVKGLECMTKQELYTIWCEVLPKLATQNRTELAVGCAVLDHIIMAISDKSVIEEMVESIFHVQRWWP
jgi:hypothetical protein